MRKNFLKIAAILIAVGFSAFTGKTNLLNSPFATHCFRFVGDPANPSEVANPRKYVETTLPPNCPQPPELVCGFCTSDEYTHPVFIGEIFIEVPNTVIDNPQNESILTLNVVTGYLDLSTIPFTQYYKLGSGTGYTPYNQEF